MGYDWHLVAAELVIVPVIVLIGILKGRVDFSLNNGLQLKAAMLTGGISELLSNVPLIKVFVQEEKADKKSGQMVNDLYRTKMKITWIGNAFAAVSTVLEVAETLIVILFGIYLIRHDYITVSIWVAFYMYSTNLTGCVDSLMSVWDDLKTAQGAMKRISEIACEKEDAYDTGEKLTQMNDDIRIEHVRFQYEEKNVLEDISFTIPKGKHTAIVGLSGAGKTTILNLLERFYEPQSGQICMGNQSIMDYSLRSWREKVGYVTQDAWVIEGTVRDNLLYALQEKISDEELLSRMKAIKMDALLKELPDGLDTLTGEGGNRLSGGQRQRICVARTLLAGPELLLLDEATSNLDALTEQSICEAVRHLHNEQTVVSVAHKLMTIEDADQIVVMANGKVDSIGTHEELMKNKGLYYIMYISQCGKGREAV